MSYMPATYVYLGLNQANRGITKTKTTNDKNCDNLLHRGREVQGGREVQADQAGRGYHRYQGGQQDPADEKTEESEFKKGPTVIQAAQTDKSTTSTSDLYHMAA